MRYLALLVLLVAACTTDPHVLDLSWSIARYDVVSPQPIACPEGWTTARFVAVDPAAPAVQHVDAFPCGALAGQSEMLPADSYQGWLEITDDAGKVVAASPPDIVDATGKTPYYTTQIFVDAGLAQANYTFADVARSCPDANGHAEPLGMRIDLALPGATPLASTFASCHAGYIRSPAVPAGTYDATFSDNGAVIATVRGVVIETPNKVTQIGPFTIP